MRLRRGAVQIYDMIINWLQVKKKQEEYMKFIVTKQHHNKRSTNGFMIKDLYQGLSFHLECVMIKINKSVAIHAKGEKR